MTKPPSTLVDRPAHRDWTVWLAGVVVAVAHLWDVVQIYFLDGRIYEMLGPQGYMVTLLAELLFAAMTGTFVVIVLTTSRRAIRNCRYRRYLTRNVTILTSTAGERRALRPHTPSGAPHPLQDSSQHSGIGEGVASSRPRPDLVRLRFNGGQAATSTGVEESRHGRG